MDGGAVGVRHVRVGVVGGKREPTGVSHRARGGRTEQVGRKMRTTRPRATAAGGSGSMTPNPAPPATRTPSGGRGVADPQAHP